MPARSCPRLQDTRPSLDNRERLVGRGRERPRCAATARRIRSATAPGPIAAVQNFRTYGWWDGIPAGAPFQTMGRISVRRLAVGRTASVGRTVTPGGGARFPESVGGRALFRGTAPDVTVTEEDIPNEYQITLGNVKRHEQSRETFGSGACCSIRERSATLVVCRRNGHRVSPALDAPGGVLRLAAVPTAPSLCVLAR